MERVTRNGPDQAVEPATPVRHVATAAAQSAPEPIVPSTTRGLWLPPGRGGGAARVARFQHLQSTHGNQATQRLLLDRPAAAPIAQRHPGRHGTAIPKGGHHQPVKQKTFLATTEKRDDFVAGKRQASRDRLLSQKRKTSLYPSFTFTVADEDRSEEHRLYVEHVSGDQYQLMIASYPLPVAAYILEMRARFQKLAAKGQTGNKKLTRMGPPTSAFLNAANAADAALLNANAVFGNVLSGDDQKLAAEQLLAAALHPLILKVFQLAKRLGNHFAQAGNATTDWYEKHRDASTNIVDPSYFLNKLQKSAERYAVEGMVAHYQDLPDYEGSGFERDHQPHNDLIETMAALPEFFGKKMGTVAAGRTQQGWAIMLQHNRHAAGRTFGNKGGIVTNAFNVALANERVNLGLAASDVAIRQFCIDYLVQSMQDDVAAMKAIANDDNQYTDMNGMDAGAKNASVARVKAQILAGEDRILASEGSIRTYDQ